MRVAKTYSFKNGQGYIEANHADELGEIYEAISALDAAECLCKVSREGTMDGKLLFAPDEMNDYLKAHLHKKGWTEASLTGKKGFKEPRAYFGTNRFREMDGIKNKVGLEIQFGKYAFMGYDIFSKNANFQKTGQDRLRNRSRGNSTRSETNVYRGLGF